MYRVRVADLPGKPECDPSDPYRRLPYEIIYLYNQNSYALNNVVSYAQPYIVLSVSLSLKGYPLFWHIST